MNNPLVEEHIANLKEDITSPIWLLKQPYPKDIPLRIDRMLKFNNAFDRYVLEHPTDINDFQLTTIQSMFRCVSGQYGGMTYFCPNCGKMKEIEFTCHSRCCTRCGKRYAESWGREFLEKKLPVRYRHIIFTLPGPLWLLVLSNPERYLTDMLNASKKVIEKMFLLGFEGTHVRPGFVSVIHMTGRYMADNPHIHTLATEGGLTSDNNWIDYTKWPYQLMCELWKHEVLEAFSSHYNLTLEEKSLLDKQRKMRFKNGTDGYVVKNYPNVMGKEDMGTYLARYVRHPPIGESRILGFDGNVVRIKYEWDNTLYETEVPIDKFIRAILVNIPPKGFQMVRWYGLYANLYYKDAKECIQGVSLNITTIEQFDDESGRRYRICSLCLIAMEPVVLYFIRNNRMVRIIY